MTKIKEVFDTIKAEDRKALINYIVVGDPDLKTTLEVMKVMVNEGVDIIELGTVSYTHLTLPTIFRV